MKLLPVSLALALSIALAACGSDDGAPPGGPDAGSADARDPTLLYVAGQYPTMVTLMQSTCQGIQVASMPTTVTHTAGSEEVMLRHASVTYSGLIERDGTFSTYPQSVGAPAETHRLTATALFSTTGSRPRSTPTCS